MSDIPDVNDGKWHRHDGGPMPVRVNERSRVRGFSAAETFAAAAIDVYWPDVFAYRVTTAHVEPPKPREWWISKHAESFCVKRSVEGHGQHKEYGDYILVREVL